MIGFSYISQGVRIGHWRRIAFVNWQNNRAYTAPIGIHLIIRLLRTAWEWSYGYKGGKFEMMIVMLVAEARRNGYVDGYETCRNGQDNMYQKSRTQ